MKIRLADRLLQGVRSKVRRIIGAPISRAAKSGWQQERLVAEPWYIDSVTPLDGGLCARIEGWALPDPNFAGIDSHARFRVNGRALETVEYPLPRPDVQKVFWQRPGADMSGFSIVAKVDYPDGVMQVSCADSTTSRHAKARETWFLPDPARHANLPDVDRRFRVIGNRDPDGFLRLGATDAYRLKAAYERVSGRPWTACAAVLDWGVGCGRIARHLAPELDDRFFGCDIDADNVAWCGANLPGSYAASNLEPPLPYGDDSFDIIYGISVFTHLRASWEQRWLKELHRVLKPGGVMLMTVHGQTAIDFAGLNIVDYGALVGRVAREGVAVTSTNNQLDGFVEHPDEYVNVFHSETHVRTVWGRLFGGIQILPGYIFTHDLVVATKL